MVCFLYIDCVKGFSDWQPLYLLFSIYNTLPPDPYLAKTFLWFIFNKCVPSPDSLLNNPIKHSKPTVSTSPSNFLSNHPVSFSSLDLPPSKMILLTQLFTCFQCSPSVFYCSLKNASPSSVPDMEWPRESPQVGLPLAETSVASQWEACPSTVI